MISVPSRTEGHIPRPVPSQYIPQVPNIRYSPVIDFGKGRNNRPVPSFTEHPTSCVTSSFFQATGRLFDRVSLYYTGCPVEHDGISGERGEISPLNFNGHDGFHLV